MQCHEGFELAAPHFAADLHFGMSSGCGLGSQMQRDLVGSSAKEKEAEKGEGKAKPIYSKGAGDTGGKASEGGVPAHLKEMRRRMASDFVPCWLLVTCSTWVRLLPLFGCRLLPLAGSNLSCMNFGTAACR